MNIHYTLYFTHRLKGNKEISQIHLATLANIINLLNMHITKLFQMESKYADKVFNSLLDLFVNHLQIKIITIHKEEITYKNELFYVYF